MFISVQTAASVLKASRSASSSATRSIKAASESASTAMTVSRVSLAIMAVQQCGDAAALDAHEAAETDSVKLTALDHFAHDPLRTIELGGDLRDAAQIRETL